MSGISRISNLLSTSANVENYADKCLGDFIADLKRRNLYNNTLLVFYGDHFGIPKLEAGESLMKFMGVENNEFEWTKLQKVPLIIHYPNVKSGVVSNTTGGQVDIMPTISNLLGIKTPYALGNDLLNNQKGYVVLRDSTVITDEFIYFASSDKLYDIKTGKPILKSSDNYMKYFEELEISDLIIQKDAFSKLELK